MPTTTIDPDRNDGRCEDDNRVGNDWDFPIQGEPNPDPVGHDWPYDYYDDNVDPRPFGDRTPADVDIAPKRVFSTDYRCNKLAKELEALLYIVPNYPQAALCLGRAEDPDGHSTFRWWIETAERNIIDLETKAGRRFDQAMCKVRTHQWYCQHQSRCEDFRRYGNFRECVRWGYACEARLINNKFIRGFNAMGCDR